MNAAIDTGSRPPLLDVLSGKVLPTPPIWMMRQAGRYLPEYRALRAEKDGFLGLVYDPPAAAEVTLQPIRRFGFDAAILFSDILLVPDALGQRLSFTTGEGPELDPPLAGARMEELVPRPARLDPVLDTVARVRAELSPEVTLIGFAGAPWTVATYMVAGRGSRDQAAARLMAYREPERFADLIGRVTEASISFLRRQADAGAQALMLFDSWSGPLSAEQFERWSIAPAAQIAAGLRSTHPHIPLIGFPRGAGSRAPAWARETGVQALGVEESADLQWLLREIPDTLAVQGNIDPLALLAGGQALDDAVDRLLDLMHGRPHIFNLGHGIIKETPIDHVQRMLDRVRGR